MIKVNIIEMRHDGLIFEALTMGSGPCVLFLHGFPDTHQTWAKQLEALSEAGYRCVAPVMRGYQAKCQSKQATYSVLDLAGDVLAWVDELQEEKVHLVGHDWGAIAAYAAANLYPDRFHSVTTLAIPHLSGLSRSMRKYPKQYLNSAYTQFFRIPLIPEWLISRNNFSFLEYIWRRWSPAWDCPDAIMSPTKSAFKEPGVVESSLAYYRAFFGAGRERSEAASVGPIDVPLMALFGQNDGCMDARMFESMQSSELFKAGLLMKQLEGAGHFMHLEKPQEVSRALLGWIGQH